MDLLLRRVALLTAVALGGCYASHDLELAPGASGTGTAPGGSGTTGTDAGLAPPTRPGAGGTPVRCFAPDVPSLVLGPEAECVGVTLSREAGASAECAFYADRIDGVPVRVVRQAAGRLDLRARSRGAGAEEAWGVFPLSADACWACPDSVPGTSGPWDTFRFEHVDDLMELVVQLPSSGTVELEACFDPEYGPPRWGS